MHVISRKPFSDAAKAYPNDAEAIARTYRVLRAGDFDTPQTLRQVFPSLDNFKYKGQVVGAGHRWQQSSTDCLHRIPRQPHVR